MRRREIEAVKPGDKLNLIPLWNRTERYRRVTNPVEVIDVREKDMSQSGILFEIIADNGESVWLDAAWFELPNGGSDDCPGETK